MSPSGEQCEPNVGTDSTATSTRRREEEWLNEGARRKLKVSEQVWLNEHKKAANRWIKDTTPNGIVLPRNKRQVWVVTRNEAKERRRIRNTAIREMPSLPFDLWLQMKDEERKSAEDTQTDKDARRLLYLACAQKRKSTQQGLNVNGSQNTRRFS